MEKPSSKRGKSVRAALDVLRYEPFGGEGNHWRHLLLHSWDTDDELQGFFLFFWHKHCCSLLYFYTNAGSVLIRLCGLCLNDFHNNSSINSLHCLEVVTSVISCYFIFYLPLQKQIWHPESKVQLAGGYERLVGADGEKENGVITGSTQSLILFWEQSIQKSSKRWTFFFIVAQ